MKKNIFSLTTNCLLQLRRINWWELFVQSSRLNEMFKNDRLGHGKNRLIESHRNGVQRKHLVQSGRLNQHMVLQLRRINWWKLFVQSSRLNEMFENDRLGHGKNRLIESHRDGVEEKLMVQSGRLNQHMAFKLKDGKPLKRLMACFTPTHHWLKPVVNENFRIYRSPRLDALLSSRNKKLSVSS